MLLKSLFTIVACFAVSAKALKCYSCTLSVPTDGSEVDMSCVDNPDNVPGKSVITCPARMKYCTIVRNDFKETGAPSSMERNCAEKPLVDDGEIEGPDLITHYRSCNTDRCNKGTGLENPDRGDDGGSQGGMVVDGIGSGFVTSASLIFCTLAVFFAYIVG